jgi:hypothetical protein
MAKLVDALPSGGSVRKDVQVRILFWARKMDKSKNNSVCPFLFSSTCSNVDLPFYYLPLDLKPLTIRYIPSENSKRATSNAANPESGSC